MAICGACWVLPRPGTGPGFTVRKRNRPSPSATLRPNPGKLSDAGGSDCQISTQASAQGLPSPSSTRPVRVIFSPSAPKRVRSAQDLSSIRCQ